MPYWIGLPVLGFVVGVITLIIVVISDVEERRMREERKKEKKLEGEAEVRFVIYDQSKPTRYQYIEQDDKEHFTKTIHLPANSEAITTIWIKPHSSYTVTDHYIGTRSGYGEKPIPIKYRNPFIKEGIGWELIPGRDPEVYTDHHDCLHIRRNRRWSNLEIYVSGFVFRTRKEGEYPTEFIILTRRKKVVHNLKIIVRESYKERLECLEHKDCDIRYNIPPSS